MIRTICNLMSVFLVVVTFGAFVAACGQGETSSSGCFVNSSTDDDGTEQIINLQSAIFKCNLLAPDSVWRFHTADQQAVQPFSAQFGINSGAQMTGVYIILWIQY